MDVWIYGHRILNGIFGLEVDIKFKMGYLDPGPGTRDPGPEARGPGPGTQGPRTRDLGPGTRAK